MKKFLTLTALSLIIATSIISGTLAVYSITLDNVAEGSVVAKAFKLVKTGTDTFTQDVKIAPTESTEMEFSITNADEGQVTETNMDLAIDVVFGPKAGLTEIPGLTATLFKGATEIGTIDSEGLSLQDGFNIQALAQTYTYKVVVNWPEGLEDETLYEGEAYGNSITVNVTGTQCDVADLVVR